MSERTRRWSRIFLMSLAAIVLASGALLIARGIARRQVEVRSYTPLTGDADWQGDWELLARGADPSQAGSLAGTDQVSIPFTGTRLALRVRRGDYRAYFWIRIDGEPANRLPQTERGAYLVLSSPDYEPQTAVIPVAGGLDEGAHMAQIVADRGWDQWPLVGWQVERGPDTALYDQWLAGLAAGAAICILGIVGCGSRWRGGSVGSSDNAQGTRGIRGHGEEILDIQPFDSIVGRLNPALRSPATLLITAGVFYVSPWLPLTLISGAALTGLMVVHLDWGLALVALSAPFYMHPRPVFGKSFSMTEILVLLCLLSWGIRQLLAREHRRAHGPLSSADLAVLALVLVSAVSTIFSEHRHVALRELRVAIFEPALFYLMLRTTRLREGAVWRIVDGFVAGAVGVALIGLGQYALDINIITAEQGFRRLRSVYGSPNNAALYLGRALPMLLAVAVLTKGRRRLVYSLFIVPVAVALLLSFSRAAILLGVPVSLLALGILAGRRWRWTTLALILVAAMAVIPLLSTPRFAGLLDPHSGTLFFRLQLWRASWKMFWDHPLLGVGPDNFLYQYRGRYILPSAWQEPHLSHAHNFLLTYATRLGILGLAVGLWLQAAFWRHSLALLTSGGHATASTRDRRALAVGLSGSMAYSLAHGMVDASTFFVDLAVALLLGLALVQCDGRYRGHE